MALRSRALQASLHGLQLLRETLYSRGQRPTAAGVTVGCSTCRRRPPRNAASRLIARCCNCVPHKLPGCPFPLPVQALAAQARAFSTQTEIAVVSGLPPLDVGRKVRWPAAASSFLLLPWSSSQAALSIDAACSGMCSKAALASMCHGGGKQPWGAPAVACWAAGAGAELAAALAACTC